MPIYEYVCQACGQHKEVLQKISDAPLTVCDACGAPKLAKQISSSGFRLTGSGWYETDFKGSKKSKPAESSGGESSSGSSDSSK